MQIQILNKIFLNLNVKLVKKTHLMKNIFLLLLSASIFTGCKHKANFDELPKVSYATDIQPIIISNCTQSGCHGDEKTQKFKLLTYKDVIKNGEIKEKSPESSELYQTIKSLNNEKIMPKKPYSPLTEKQIQLIYVWIGQGALNN